MRRRAVSSTLNYVLALAITTLLITGLIIAATGFVTSQRDVVVREEMEVIGQHIASNVEQADRLVDASNGTAEVEVSQTFPGEVSRTTYDVELLHRPDASDQIVLRSTSPEKTVRVNVSTATTVQNSTADGGKVTIEYDSSAADPGLVITDD